MTEEEIISECGTKESNERRREKVLRILRDNYDWDRSEDADPCPVDLLADIMHYCDKYWGAFEHAYETAEMHHAAERIE